MGFIIFFAIAMTVVCVLHSFVMKSVNGYEGYGSRDVRRDWREFQSSKTGLF